MRDSRRELRAIQGRANGGVDEVSAGTELNRNDFVEMVNLRHSKDGQWNQKRDGLSALTTTSITATAKQILGYFTCYDDSDNFVQIVATDTAVWRKIGAAAWASVHTWTSQMFHPIKIHHFQDKVIIVTEEDNIMFLDNGGGTKVQLGITAPTTLPTLAGSFENTAALDEDFDYADTAAMTSAGWVDDDNSGTSALSASDPNSTEGPDADSKYLRLYDGSPGSGRYASRYREVASIPSEFDLETDIYFDDAGYKPWNGEFQIHVYNGIYHFEIIFCASYVWIHNGVQYKEVWKPPGNNIEDKWWNFKCHCTEDEIKFYVDDVLKHTLTGFSRADTSTTSRVQLKLMTGHATYGDGDVYVDNIKVSGGEGTGNLNGTYRYAVTYARNSGNYPGESNPIKSSIGSVTQTGSGLDDLTITGTYTGDEEKTIRVQIDGEGTPDTIKWSDDGGESWRSYTYELSTKMYLPWGVELNWGATTGHTSGDYWEFTVKPCIITCTNQKVTLSSIPTSSDSQVTQRKIYRTRAGGVVYYHLATINNNTTTSFVDNFPDSALGLTMEEDNDVPPNGKFSAIFDNKLWILDDDENILYYSKDAKPDQFNQSGSGSRYVSLRDGSADDECTGIIPYAGHLYAFKRESIYQIRKKLNDVYGRYEIINGLGNIAPFALIEVYGLILFVSWRGWEAFNGERPYAPEFSYPISDTLSTIDKSYTDRISVVHNPEYHEVWLSIPNRTGQASAVTVVNNYHTGKFYTFSFHKTPSCLVAARDSNKERQVYLGTTDGYTFTTDSGTQDGTTNINAYARSGFHRLGRNSILVRSDWEFEGPDGNAWTITHYMDQDKDSQRSVTLAGNDPASADQSSRQVQHNRDEFYLRGEYFAFKFSNNENVGSNLRIGRWIYEYQAILHIKGDIAGD
jgi:hypothetical protein